MRKIIVFNNISVDGYFAGPNGEIDWFKGNKDLEYEAFTKKGASSGGTLIFGQTTYELMKGFWPTKEALKLDPDMAEVVNNSPKIVFSKSLKSVKEGPHWKNITLFSEIRPTEIIRLKMQEGKDMTILGSGMIVQQFTNFGLIDEYQLIVNRVKKLKLKLLDSKTFKNGLVWLRYQPEK